MGIFDFSEILLQRFYENFRSLYTSKYDAQMALSRCCYTFHVDEESSEVFLVLDTCQERLGDVVNTSQLYLQAAKNTGGFDGVWIHVMMEPFKLLRIS
jgi:hypothetical protein